MRSRVVLLLFYLISLTLSEFILNAETNTIKHGRRHMNLREGRFVGRIEEASGQFGEVYHSIPYAEKPDDELRFEMPRPIRRFNGTLETEHAAHCFQFSTPIVAANHTTMDCLHVKIVIPLDAHHQRYKESLPVLMWIHGGSYQYLGKSLYNTSGILTAFSSRKVIFVSVAYRLGLFGFLSLLSPDLPGNFAIHDLSTAIRFIHSNAAFLGADSSRISIAGESAGAAAASILAVSPLTKGLISSVIPFSGSIYAPWAVRTQSTYNHSISFIRQTGCERETVLEMKRCMQHLPMEKLREHEKYFMTETEKNLYELYRMGCAAFTPVEDEFMEDLSQIPHDMRRLGMLEDVVRMPMLLSTTADERLVATKELVNSEFEKVGRSVINFLPLIMSINQPSRAEVITTITSHYFGGRSKMDNDTFERLLTVSQNGEQYAAVHAEALDYASGGQKVYVLKSDVHDGTFPTWHGVDVWILFDCFDMAHRSGFADWSYEKWRSFDNFRNRLADTIVEFIWTSQLRNHVPFSHHNRVATKISQEKLIQIDADTNDFYFWKMTLPYIESLDDSSLMRLAVKNLMCTNTYQIPFYMATTLLIACMIACGFLFTQRKRRLSRDRKALRHVPLG